MKAEVPVFTTMDADKKPLSVLIDLYSSKYIIYSSVYSSLWREARHMNGERAI